MDYLKLENGITVTSDGPVIKIESFGINAVYKRTHALQRHDIERLFQFLAEHLPRAIVKEIVGEIMYEEDE